MGKLLNSRTGQQRRPETEPKVPPGYNFTPTDQQLIVDYLLPYALEKRIHWSNVVVEERVYEKKPDEILRNDDVRYFLTKRTKCGGRVKRSFNGGGTWTVKEGKREIKSADGVTIIGHKTMLSYCVEGKSEGYTMYEYELPQSVTNNFMQEEGAPTLHERVLCCVKKSPQKIADSKRSRPETATVTKAAIAGSKRVPHDGAFEVSGEYLGCNTSAAVVVAAASYNTEPLTEDKTASSMHLPTAAEASLEGRVHTEASDFASADQIMSSSAVDQLPSACCGSYWTEDKIRAVVSDTCKQYEFEMTAAEVATTALPPSSGQDGAIYTGDLGWLSNVRCSPQPLPIDMEMLPPMNLPPNSALDLPPESVPAVVATLAAAYYSVTSPIVAEASLEGRVNTETIKLASTDQIMSPSAVNQQPPANNNSYRMEEVINTDISDTCKGYELTAEVVATAEQPINWDMLWPLDSLPSDWEELSLSDFLKPPPESTPVDVVTSTAANCSAMSLIYATDYNPTPPMCLSTAAEASLEGGVHTETIELASTDQRMSSSAIDQQPPAYSDRYQTEEMINAGISDTCEMTTAEQHLPPPSCQDGDQPTASAIHTGQNYAIHTGQNYTLLGDVDTGSKEISTITKKFQSKLEIAQAELVSEREKASKEIQKLTAENMKLQYRISHLIRALNEADSKLAA